MIEREKNNGSGYLRTGQILQLMGNIDTALDIYQLGLRNVPTSDIQAKILQNLRDNLNRRCSPQKAVDPMASLPMEIVELIIGYLTFRQIVTLLRVSKSWKSLLSSLPRLWTDLDMRSSTKTVNYAAVRQYVRNAQRTCVAIRFGNFGKDQQGCLDHAISRCKELQDLRISAGLVGARFAEHATHARYLRTLIISSQVEIHIDIAMQLINQCVSLEHAEFHRIQASDGDVIEFRELPNLRTLMLHTFYTPPRRLIPVGARLRIDHLVENVTNVRSLTLRGWQMRDTVQFFSSLHKLEYLDISGSTGSLQPDLPVTLRSLNMSNCVIGHTTPIFQSQILPTLSTLIVENYENVPRLPFFPPGLLRMIEASKGVLQTLDLSGFTAIMNNGNNEVSSLVTSGSLTGVEKLRLSKIPKIDDALVILIAETLQQLKSLDLACTEVTGVGVKALLISLGSKLEWLGLDECHHTSIDAVELARSMGVKVSYKFPDSKGGKKIRRLQ